jgi:hypothetical protein
MSSPPDGFLRQLRPASLSDPLFLLIVANAITILLAMGEGWNLIEVLLVYWFQSVTIGFFAVLQMLLYRGPGIDANVPGGLSPGLAWLRKVGMAAFFCVHYGFFHLIYLGFILAFSWIFGLGFQDVSGLLPACAFFLVTHLYSFLFYRKREEVEGLTLSEVFSRPYTRILPMHLTIMAAFFIGFPAASLGMDVNRIILLIFLVLKTLADLWGHVRKHRHTFVQVVGTPVT